MDRVDWTDRAARGESSPEICTAYGALWDAQSLGSWPAEPIEERAPVWSHAPWRSFPLISAVVNSAGKTDPRQ